MKVWAAYIRDTAEFIALKGKISTFPGVNIIDAQYKILE